MMYAEVKSGVVTKYPLTIYQIRSMYPNTSWPDNPDSTVLASVDLVIVYPTTPPSIKKSQCLYEGTPVYNPVAMQWQQVWIVTSK